MEGRKPNLKYFRAKGCLIFYRAHGLKSSNEDWEKLEVFFVRYEENFKAYEKVLEERNKEEQLS